MGFSTSGAQASLIKRDIYTPSMHQYVCALVLNDNKKSVNERKKNYRVRHGATTRLRMICFLGFVPFLMHFMPYTHIHAFQILETALPW